MSLLFCRGQFFVADNKSEHILQHKFYIDRVDGHLVSVQASLTDFNEIVNL